MSLLFSHPKVEAFVRAEPSGTQKGVRERMRTVNAMRRRIDDVELGARGTDPTASEEMCRAYGAWVFFKTFPAVTLRCRSGQAGWANV